MSHVQGAQFGLTDVEVVTATVDLDDVVSFRGAIASLREQASTVERCWIKQALTIPMASWLLLPVKRLMEVG